MTFEAGKFVLVSGKNDYVTSWDEDPREWLGELPQDTRLEVVWGCQNASSNETCRMGDACADCYSPVRLA